MNWFSFMGGRSFAAGVLTPRRKGAKARREKTKTELLRRTARVGFNSRISFPLCGFAAWRLGVKKVGPPLLIALALAFAATAHAETNATQPTVIVLVGAAGEEDFGKVFIESAAAWQKAAEKAEANFTQIGGTDAQATNDLAEFRLALGREAKTNAAELWLVLLGHGTFDGKEAKFNLRGPDLSASVLSNLLAGFQRPVAIINTASASAPFLKALSATNRVVITATRSGAEENYARLGKFISEAISDPEADLDKDGQVSLLETFLTGSRRVAEFYQNDGRLATEHALLDDNGDGLGTPADWFRGLRAVKTPAQAGAVDGMRAHQWHLIRSVNDQKLTVEQHRQRDALELEILQLRRMKATMREEDYYQKLEALLTKLAEIELAGQR